MEGPLEAATRPSRLPALTHITVVVLLSLSFISGLGVWRGEILQARSLETPAWLHGSLILHGCLNPLLCVLFAGTSGWDGNSKRIGLRVSRWKSCLQH